MEGKLVYRYVSCPSCDENHLVKKGRMRERQEYLCRNCGRQFVEGAKHCYDKIPKFVTSCRRYGHT
ncbi:IS1/IS1595 family N-terminal zinc-binding domain-containing protein [Metallosphaera sedula]|uniref:IS1/IS1595 family N-terminal zinc-binding domain-containing protein n=1 Tax=Metallosphaera TaxID=41980 RepID=UPI003D039C6F